MNITYLICALVFPLLAIFFGNKYRKNPPDKIAKGVAYSTQLSMQNRQAWNFAHRYIGTIWFYGGIVFCIASLLVVYFTKDTPKANIETFIIITIVVQLILLGATVVPTEIKLSKKFPIDKKSMEENMNKKIKILIDADTGIDDALAILYALKNPKVEVLGIVSGRGNVDAVKAADNTLRIIELANPNYNVPVVVGSDVTLEGESRQVSSHVHGENGIGNVDLPKPKQKPLDVDFKDFIYNTLKNGEGEVIVVTLGHMTNIAMAMEKYPEIPSLAKKLVVMGGAVKDPGNVLPHSEANIYGDPLAADKVFMADFKTTIVPLDVTMKVLMSKKDIEKLVQTCKPENKQVAEFIKNSFSFYMDFYKEVQGLDDVCPLHDPLAMLVAVNPYIVKTQAFPIRVETKGEFTRGMFVCDARYKKLDCKQVEIAMEVDEKNALNAILDTLK